MSPTGPTCHKMDLRIYIIVYAQTGPTLLLKNCTRVPVSTGPYPPCNARSESEDIIEHTSQD